MSKVVPLRQIYRNLRTVQVQVQFMLAVEGINWQLQDYATFFAMTEQSRVLERPDRKQLLTHIGAWLKFYKQLIDKLPEGLLIRDAALVEFDKVSEPYQGLL